MGRTGLGRSTQRNAAAVFKTVHEAEWGDLMVMDALRAFHFKRSEILVGGGSKSVIAQRLDGFLATRGWKEREFKTKIIVDQTEYDSPTHKVDCFKGRVALEIEWNNKDPFFDRDLNNFRLLFELRAIDVGVIITRATELQALFRSLGPKVGAKYGSATTHWQKLYRRIEGGGGGGCPILIFGITQKRYVEDHAPMVAPASSEDDA
ncbi:hypothetical protein J4558_25475 [Leptolyngbya sp. 15MV]|nr:hypothetical protein J4558_25475 [Leptolyngbya sp. 15MV]